MIRIAVDCMGGDHGVAVTLPACRAFLDAHPDAELVELAWVPITAAREFDLPIITGLVLEELQKVLLAGYGADQNFPVPFFMTRDGEFMRELIE